MGSAIKELDIGAVTQDPQGGVIYWGSIIREKSLCDGDV